LKERAPDFLKLKSNRRGAKYELRLTFSILTFHQGTFQEVFLKESFWGLNNMAMQRTQLPMLKELLKAVS
jgi:hypothetical protein